MTTNLLTRSTLLGAAAVLTIGLSACGSSDASTASASSGTGASAGSSAPMTSSSAMPAAAQPFGTGCSAVPANGAGSFAGMAQDPVATAAGNNPALSTLVSAVQAAGLVDSLNSASDITVLAPANGAFDAVPADALKALLADKTKLTAVLTHHVIAGRLTPQQLAGTHTTLAGDDVTIAGSGEHFTIAGTGTVLKAMDATVVCGNVQTANATVYIIDQVLAPAA